MQIVETIKSSLDWLKNFMKDDGGIRTFYIVLLIIPSACFLWLYTRQLDENERLNVKNAKYEALLQECYVSKDNLRKEIRDELYLEFKKVADMVNVFKNDIHYENKNLKNEADKLNEEINQLNKK